jgi:PD-(D/E)XK nuclease superfamily
MNCEHQTIKAGECLIAKIVSELMQAHASIPATHVILPTQRLHLYVTRELCRLQNGAALLPHLWTWDQFVEEVTAENITQDKVMVSSQCELIMEHVLVQQAQRQTKDKSKPDLNTNSRHAHELVYFAGELAKAGLSQVAQEKLDAYLQRDWRRSEDVFVSVSKRIDDVFSALSDYGNLMTKMQWTTPEAARSGAVTRWLESNTADQIKSMPQGRIIIAGLTSLPLLESKLLGTLSRQDNVSVWIDESPPFDTDSPILELRRVVGLPPCLAPKEIWACGVKSIVSAFDITHEVAHTLLRVREWLDSGISAHEIAIIVPDESSHGPALLALASTAPCPINMPLARPWATTFIGRWLSLVTELTRTYDIHIVGQYILHPLTQFLFGASPTFNSEDLQYQLKNFPIVAYDPSVIFSFLRQHQEGHAHKKFSASDVAFIEKAILWCSSLDFPHLAGAQEELARVFSALETAPLLTSQSLSEAKKSQASFKILRKATDQVCELGPLRGYRAADWKNLLKDIYRTASEESVRDPGEPLTGLQILGLTEARYVPFAAALIVGCAEGSFPHGLPKDSLLDNNMKGIIGLPGWTELEALEDTTFHLLTSRLPHVELSYPKTDCGSPKIRSRWIEQLAQKLSVHEVNGARAHDLFPRDKGRLISTTPETCEGFAADHSELTKTASATRLKNLLWCPYRYLMDARKLMVVELPEDREAQSVGTYLHAVVEAFFNQPSEIVVEGDLQLSACPKEPELFKNWAGRRLHALAQIIVPPSFARAPKMQHMTGTGWGKVADFWSGLLAAGFPLNKVAAEIDIGKSGNLTMSFSGRQIVIHGKIDAVHASTAATLLVDYKTTVMPTAGNIADGLEPQLILYAHALSNSTDANLQPFKTNVDRTAVAYYSFIDGKARYVSIGAEAKAHFLEAKIIGPKTSSSDLASALAAVQSRWQQRLETIDRTHHFDGDPSDCKYCHFAGICRKDDPRYRDRFTTQKIAKPPPTTLEELTTELEAESKQAFLDAAIDRSNDEGDQA